MNVWRDYNLRSCWNQWVSMNSSELIWNVSSSNKVFVLSRLKMIFSFLILVEVKIWSLASEVKWNFNKHKNIFVFLQLLFNFLPITAVIHYLQTHSHIGSIYQSCILSSPISSVRKSPKKNSVNTCMAVKGLKGLITPQYCNSYCY